MATTGIYAIEVYVPPLYVTQTDLEKQDGVAGKYVKGLGQHKMSFLSTNEDIYSIALTVVHNIMKKYNVPYEAIGRLAVGSETIHDHSKSIKSHIMQLFEKSGNYNVEGVDYIHACYAGAAALFDSFDWVNSAYNHENKLALLVACDIAEYATGPARPTGGCGAIAMIIGSDSNPFHHNLFNGKPMLTLDPIRASYSRHAYDFYKPNLSSPYPEVDGKLSNSCYLESVDQCYTSLSKIMEKKGQSFRGRDAEYFVFHSPYTKLSQKGYARIIYNDFLQDFCEKKHYDADLQGYLKIKREDTLNDGKLMKYFLKKSEPQYKKCVYPAYEFGSPFIGNTYTASIFFAILCLITTKTVQGKAESLQHARVGVFSYGSGICSSIFFLRFTENTKLIERVAKLANLQGKISDKNRRQVPAAQFVQTLEKRESLYVLKDLPFVPEEEKDVPRIEDHYLLARIDKRKRREYILKKGTIGSKL